MAQHVLGAFFGTYPRPLPEQIVVNQDLFVWNFGNERAENMGFDPWVNVLRINRCHDAVYYYVGDNEGDMTVAGLYTALRLHAATLWPRHPVYYRVSFWNVNDDTGENEVVLFREDAPDYDEDSG